jgi:prepilin-type N-terminal cleavage/methylation domain-containing protein
MFIRRSARGFTLIELLVVIAIIGILSSVVLASLNTARQKSRDARRIADVKQIQLALELYFDSKATYPSSTTQLTPTYISILPKDPLTRVDYTYAGVGSGATCTSYHLGVALEQTGHTVLGADADAAVAAAVCTSSAADFSGLSTAAAGVQCNTTAGTGGPGGTETCYDVIP